MCVYTYLISRCFHCIAQSFAVALIALHRRDLVDSLWCAQGHGFNYHWVHFVESLWMSIPFRDLNLRFASPSTYLITQFILIYTSMLIECVLCPTTGLVHS